jgi:hypothetical protein
LRSISVAVAVAVVALAGCGSSSEVKSEFLRGVAQIRSTHDDKRLRLELADTSRRLALDDPKNDADRRAKRLALRGFALTLRAIDSQIDFTENDSGNVATATRDASRAYSSLVRAGRLLRMAGRAYGMQIKLPPP